MNAKPLIVLLSVSCALLFGTGYAAGNALEQTTHDEYPTYPTIHYGSGDKAKQLKRGEQLVKLGDCIACHTAHHGGKPFAGGFGIDTPFGTIYTPNLTSDKETGIGNWSQADFDRAMRKGISPQGTYYYPAFPYPYFNILTDQDLKDIHAYLRAIPAVRHENKKNSMMFPFNWRFLQLGWRMMFFQFQQQGPYQNNPNKSELWNRGNYLVNGLGHCGMCHTPSYYLLTPKYSLAAPKRKYAFAGNMVQGYYAPNISSTLLKGTPLQEFSDVFLKDRLIGGGNVVGPMKEANHNSLKYLTANDIKAVNIYLLSIKSELPKKHSSGSGGPGKGIYEQYCTGCHTTGAGGAPKLGDGDAWAPLIKTGLNTLYKNAIKGINGMPAKGTCISCTNQEIQDAVKYIVNQSQSGGGHDSHGGKPIPLLTLKDGEHLYQKHCAVCHTANSTNPHKGPAVGDEAAWKPIIAQGLDIAVTHTINGYGKMPRRGGCNKCNDADIKAAVKYMVQHSQTGKDYSLW